MEQTKPKFSLSISSTNPMAESTQINSTNSTNHFPWGGTVISPKRRSSTSSLTSGNMTVNSVQPTLSPIKSKIDPRVYIDVHSKGLTSRIVRYHEHNAGLSRSLSSSSLYKPGQFPLVHLKTADKPCIAVRNQNLSMVRIAPPEKSVFQGSTLSSILRSGSVVGISSGLQKCGTNISHENRPILHPPPTENEMAPTRSVLEVLKEISRKRINSDDLEDENDSAKKHRKGHSTELQEHQLLSDSTKQLHQSITRQKTLVVKRQRENHSSTTSNQPMPSDQIFTKRLCRNNDITSSLSSSKMLMSKTKRKKHGNDSLDSFRKPKQMCSEICNVEHNLSASQSSIDNPIKPKQPVMSEQQTVPISFENIVDSKQKSTTKSKVTLFNRDYSVSKEFQGEITNETNALAIQFVKPKKNGSICTTKNVVIERSQKSKLALMLSGLKGELNYVDEHDSSETEQTKSFETELKIADTNVSVILNKEAAIISFDTTTATVTTTTTSPILTSKLPPLQQNNNLRSKLKQNMENQTLTLPVPTPSSGDFAPISHSASSIGVEGSLKPAALGGFKFDPSTNTSLMAAIPTQPLPITKSSVFVSSSKLTINAPTSTISVPIMKTGVNSLSDLNSNQDHNANNTNVAESSSLNPNFSFGSSISVAPSDKPSFAVPLFTFGKKASSSIVSTAISTSSTNAFAISSLASKNSQQTSFLGNSLTSSLNVQSVSSTAASELTSLSKPTSLTKSATNLITTSFGNNESNPVTSIIGDGTDANHQNKNLGISPLDNHTSTLQSPSFNLVTQSFGTTSFNNAQKAPISQFCSSVPTVSTSSSLNAFRFGNNAGENTTFNSLGHGDSIPTPTANGFSFPNVPQTFGGLNSTTQSKTSIFGSSQSIMPHKGFGDSNVTKPIDSKSIFGGANVLQPNSGFSIFGTTNKQTPDSSGQNKVKQNNDATFAFGDSTSGKTTVSNNFSFNALPISSSNVPAKLNSDAFANSSIQLKNTTLESKNSFGSSTLTTQSSFSFGNSATTTNSKPPIFGSISSAVTTATANQQSNDKNLFGGFDSSANTQTSPSTASSNPSNNIFGSSLAPLRESPFEPSGPHKVFSFNAGTTSNSGNSFILNGMNHSNKDSVTSFSFGQHVNASAVQAQSINNVFLGNSAQQLDSNNLMNQGGMPGQPMINDRPIRKATRRLHK